MVELTPFAHRVQLISGLVAALAVLALLLVTPRFNQQPLNTLEKIQQRGYVNVLTLNGATTYYQDVDGPNGFEYQLASWFAESIGVEARFVVVPSFAELYPELLFNSGDIVAAGLSRHDPNNNRLITYGPGYHQVTHQLLYQKHHGERPRDLGDLSGETVKIIKGTAHVKLLRSLRQDYPQLSWNEVDDIAVEELIEQVDSGKAEYILADSHKISLHRRYFPELRVAFDLGKPRQLRWAYKVQPEDDSLAEAIGAFFAAIGTDGRLEQLIHRHFSHVAKFNYSDIQTFTQRIDTHLPKYEDLFRIEAEATGLDWRLLAAIGYQESLWNPHAKSPTGVRGLMMLTRITARQMKVKNRLDPAQSIRGGAAYFVNVHGRIPERIPEPDRTWLALTAYNVGFGHMEDARVITQKRGGNPDRWIDVKQSLPLLARKKWYKQTKFGFARGWEPVIYVENIRKYYDYLVGIENRALRGAGEDKPLRDAAPLAPSL